MFSRMSSKPPIHGHSTFDGTKLGCAQKSVPSFVTEFHTWHHPELIKTGSSSPARGRGPHGKNDVH